MLWSFQIQHLNKGEVMSTPLDGIKIGERALGVGRLKEGFTEINLASVEWEGKCYAYSRGKIYGPVSEVLCSMYVQPSNSLDARPLPTVIKFRQGKKVGVFVEGVRSELFDEVGDFRTDARHFRYSARRGQKWCFVIDGVIHGWYNELNCNLVWYQRNEDKENLLFWAQKNGRVGYWLNDQPIATFDAKRFEVSYLKLAGDKLAFEVTRDAGTEQKAMGVWFNGKVERWFNEIKPFHLRLIPRGVGYVGVDPEGSYLRFCDEWLGPFDNISWWPQSETDLGPNFLVAVFKKDDKQCAQIGNWRTGWHKTIQDPERIDDGYRLVIGYDEIEGVDLYTYYVDERIICTVPNKDGYIMCNRLCFKENVVTGYFLD